MEYRFLGHTGMRVSELALGTMTFGESNWGLQSQTPEDEAHEMLTKFVERGGNLIDTADAYGVDRASERVVGRWVEANAAKRNDMVLATKLRIGLSSDVNNVGLSRKHIKFGIEESLRALKTDYVDLLQLHIWDAGTPLEETVRTLSELVRAGKVHYIGVSNYSGYQLQKIFDIGKYCGLEMVASTQMQYSLLERSVENEVIPVCCAEDIGLLSWSPLKGGWLAGRYTRDSPPPSTGRVAWAQAAGWKETNYDAFATEKTWTLLDRLREVGERNGKTMAQTAMRWTLQRPGVAAVIVGARTLKHFEDNMGATGWTLSTEDMQVLTDASAVEVPYPQRTIANRNTSDGRVRP